MKPRTAHALAFGAVLAASGCDDPVVSGTPGSAKPAAPAAAAPPKPGATGTAAPPSPTANMPALPKRDFQERDFVESDTSRDPFHSYAAELVSQGKKAVTIQRKVMVDRYAIEELKLVGVVLGNPSRALLIDPTGLGWIVKVGDFVGRPELVHSGVPGAGDVPINWRVDRIRAADVVFLREDPSHPEIPPSTRFIALRTPEETAKAAMIAPSSP